MDNPINFDIDKLNKMEEVAHCLGAVVLTTLELKKIDVPDDEVIPAVTALLGIDIEIKPEHKEMIPSIITMLGAYSKITNAKISDTIEMVLQLGKK